GGGSAGRAGFVHPRGGVGAPAFGVRSRREEPPQGDVALAASARRNVELQVRVTARNFTDAPYGGFWQRRAAEIGVQNYTGGINDRAERKRHGCAQAAGNRVRQARQGKLHVLGADQTARGNLFAQLGQHGADRICQRRLAFPGKQRREFRRAEQVVDRGKKAVEIGFGRGIHRSIFS